MEAQSEDQAGVAVAPTGATTAPPQTEPKEVAVHIKVPGDEYQRLRKCADYAVAEGLIIGHHLGNVTAYVDFCLRIGEEALRQHEIKARGIA